MQQRGMQVRYVMQRRRTENQVEPIAIHNRHQVAHAISNVIARSSFPSDRNQRLADVDSNDVVIIFGEGQRMAAGSAPSIESSCFTSRELGDETIPDGSGLECGEPIVVSGEVIERLRLRPYGHVPTLACARLGREGLEPSTNRL